MYYADRTTEVVSDVFSGESIGGWSFSSPCADFHFYEVLIEISSEKPCFILTKIVSKNSRLQLLPYMYANGYVYYVLQFRKHLTQNSVGMEFEWEP